MGDTKSPWFDTVASAFFVGLRSVVHASACLRPRRFTVTQSNFNPYEDTFTRNLVERKTDGLIGKYGYTEVDRDDLQQDIYVRVMQGVRLYDSREGHRNKFVTAIVERYVANIVRNRCAEKRCDANTILLSTPLTQSSGETLRISHVISDTALDRHTGRMRRSQSELSDLRSDLQNRIDELPAHQRHLIELRKTMTITEIADKFGVARTTASGWFRKIREHFEDAGLAEYFDRTSSVRT